MKLGKQWLHYNHQTAAVIFKPKQCLNYIDFRLFSLIFYENPQIMY